MTAFELYVGDMREQLAELPRRSVDAIVCDPPYEIEFLGRAWDSSGVAFDVETWRACLRVLKPGGHLIAFGATRTFHRIAVAIEDAGFDVRDTIGWCYKSGFPKSLDVAKAIDKEAGIWRGRAGAVTSQSIAMAGPSYEVTPKGDPATDEARRWQGWGTSLKPAIEPAILARKPLVGTVVDNVRAYGTGAINIDDSRVGAAGRSDLPAQGEDNSGVAFGGALNTQRSPEVDGLGRWPANLILDEATAFEIGDERTFFVAKPSTAERENGLDFLPRKLALEIGAIEEIKADPRAPERRLKGDLRDARGRANIHSTVKPIALMRYLTRLVTPPGGTILDPFAGSGTTGIAALQEGFRFVGVELDTAHACIAWHRIATAARSLEGAERRRAQRAAEDAAQS